jgi:serine/threonine-protein kinase
LPPSWGATFGPYWLRNRLGKSRTAIVFRAIRDNAEVALKIFLGDADDAERAFLNEVNAEHRLLEHPHILYYSHYGKQDGYFYVETPYCELGTLEAYREGNRSTRRESLSIVLQIARAVEYAHSRGVIHADLKPRNILVVAPGDIVVSDFSLAHVHGAASVTGPHGTVGWSAPEQLAGVVPTTAADVYAFAKTALWVLGVEAPQKLRVPSLRNLLRGCLLEVPNARPAMKEVRQVLEQIYRNRSEE